MKTISVIGSTGSIGVQTLEVCRKHNIKITALSANRNVRLLAEQAKEFSVKYACICDGGHYNELRDMLSGTGIKVLCGEEGLCEIASLDGVDLLVNALVGIAGLLPTLKAIEKGTDIALANKETLVAGGELVMESARKKGIVIFPVDSEHSAVFQCLQGNDRKQLSRIILTASGGPFFGMKKDGLKNITVSQALSHPNWSMGSKITIDSATLMNKGLEFIEAVRLFGVKPGDIEIVINRESVLHSAVEFSDYSVIGQLGTPDMKIPIQYALLYPERVSCDVKRLSLTDYGTLTFFKPDYETFDCLSACIEAVKLGGAYPCIVNGVNEEAVKLFLEGKIPFLKIGEFVKDSLGYFNPMPFSRYEDIINADKAAREYARHRTV